MTHKKYADVSEANFLGLARLFKLVSKTIRIFGIPHRIA